MSNALLAPAFAPARRTAGGIFVVKTELPVIYLARHGETAWSLTGQHTGLTDLPLTERDEQNASALGDRLKGLNFVKVFTSPCSAHAGPVSWPASARQPKSIATCWSGIRPI